MKEEVKVFALSRSKKLGESIAKRLGWKLGSFHSSKFSDGEVYTRFEESIRGEIVILISQVNMPYEHLFELFITIDAARRASAKEIICVLPYLPHSRQERKDDFRSSVTARLIANFLESSGIDRIITIDLHSRAIEGFFMKPVDHLEISKVFIDHIQKNLNPKKLCLCSPDFGGLKRIRKYKKVLDCEMAAIHKERLAPNQVHSMEIIGEVRGKDVVIIDDMVDTAGTLVKASSLIMEMGANSVRAYCTHGIFSGNAQERIQNSDLKCIYVSDTIEQNIKSSKIKVISCAELLANAIERLLNKKSVKEMNNV